MEQTERLARVLAFIRARGWTYSYHEEEDCGSIDFDYRGVPYHIWEFKEEEYGAESNVRNGGRQEDFFGDYETELLELMKDWK